MSFLFTTGSICMAIFSFYGKFQFIFAMNSLIRGGSSRSEGLLKYGIDYIFIFLFGQFVALWSFLTTHPQTRGYLAFTKFGCAPNTTGRNSCSEIDLGCAVPVWKHTLIFNFAHAWTTRECSRCTISGARCLVYHGMDSCSWLESRGLSRENRNTLRGLQGLDNKDQQPT